MEFYGSEHQEILTAKTIEEHIQEYIEQIYPDLPEKEIEVYKYTTKKIENLRSDWMLETIEESLSEEYGDPEGNIEWPEECKKTWDAFISSIKENYTPWQCDMVKEPIKVKIEEYIDES